MIFQEDFFGKGAELTTGVTAAIHMGARVWSVKTTAAGLNIVFPPTPLALFALRLGELRFIVSNRGANSFNLFDFESFFVVADGQFFLSTGAPLAPGKVALVSLINFGGTPGWNMTRWNLVTNAP